MDGFSDYRLVKVSFRSNLYLGLLTFRILYYVGSVSVMAICLTRGYETNVGNNVKVRNTVNIRDFTEK
jgi:hypothetical protein